MKLSKPALIKLGSVVGIVILGFLIMFVLGSTEKESNKREVEPEVRLVEIQSVNFEDLILEIEGNGVVESKKTLKVISEATGPVVYARNDLKDGTFVSAGDKILEVDSREVENALYTLRSEFINSLALVLPEIKVEDTDAYNKWYGYFQSLDIHETMPELPELSGSQEKIKLSTRNVFSKYYSVKNQEILLSKYKITAPFTGYIKSNGIVEGSFVSKGSHLFTLSDAVDVEIAVPLLVDEINLINFSSPPTAKVFPDKHEGEVILGKIYRKETLLNRDSQTMNVYISFKNRKLNPYFLPGNYVKVKIEGMELKNVAKIPRYVLDNENFVYTMEAGKLARRKVEIIAMQNNDAIIKKVNQEEMKLITTILQKPLIGMQVKSVNESIELKEEVSDDSETIQLSKSN
ncbi:MAG: efflux RND transporter periplasmic adaptor subunit [Ignavibacteriaceae bacterium]|nr:efflux RND transporter periplasmic adaptor subunit [Ignavibacteriaceae bacterium]